MHLNLFLKPFQNNNLVKHDIYTTENVTLNADFKGLFLGIHENRGLLIWLWQNQGLFFVKKKKRGGGCSFTVGTQYQTRV